MIKLKEITGHDYLIECVLSHKFNTETREEAIEGFKNNLVFGYEVYLDGVIQGVAYSLKNGDTYSLDGYNKGTSGLTALLGARKVIKRLFNEYTDTVYSYHPIKDAKSTRLLKALRFKEVRKTEDHIFFKLTRKESRS